jgi:hypothetical protein
MGMPWLSQPGTYGASKPWSEAWRTAASFQILFAAVPMWMWLFEYGGPSWSSHGGRFFLSSRSRA